MVGDVGDPVAHGFADGVFEGAAAVGHGNHLRPQQTHAEDVEALPAHVLFAHVDGAIEAEQRADRGRRDAVLARAGFGDDAALAHAPGEQRLAEAVIDLVRAGVEQVFALDVDLRAEIRREAARVVERRRAAGVSGEELVELAMEGRILAGFALSLFQFFERRHQDFRDVTPAVRTEMSARVGLRCHDRALFDELFHARVVLAARGFLDAEATSTAHGSARPDGFAHVIGIQAAREISGR